MSRRLNIVYALDAAGSAHAGGLVSADRIMTRLREHHDVTSIGVGGDVALKPLLLPIGQDLVTQSSFTFARPDTALLRKALSRADVLHVQLPFFLGFRAVRIAEELGLPIVAGHHVQPENVLAGIALKAPRIGALLDRPRVARWLNRLVVHTFYNRATAVICPSPLAKGELIRAGLTAYPVIISNGAPDEFAPVPRVVGGPFTLLSVGRLVPEKRHDVIIEAARRSRFASRLRVVIAGKGPLEQRLRAQAVGHPSQIELGFVSDAELLHLCQSADLYVHASQVELEGMAALEAMRCGCPAIIADARASATTQFALDATHLFPPGDAGALARHIDDWFVHRDRLDAARARTLASVSGFSMAATLAAYEQLYLSVAASRKLPTKWQADLALGSPIDGSLKV